MASIPGGSRSRLGDGTRQKRQTPEQINLRSMEKLVNISISCIYVFMGVHGGI